MTTSLLMVLEIALCAWSLRLATPLSSRQPIDDPSKPDSYMRDVVATQFDKDGKITMKLMSPKMTHFTVDDKMHITTPEVTLFRKSPKPWYIHSEYADAKHGIDEILFSNNVRIQHPADTENPETSLTTRSLTIFPDQKMASTKEAVVFTQPDTIVHAVGMLADLDEGSIKLLSEAQGEYAPTS
jgi:lipopolysaccharide export system protein LptC